MIKQANVWVTGKPQIVPENYADGKNNKVFPPKQPAVSMLVKENFCGDKVPKKTHAGSQQRLRNGLVSKSWENAPLQSISSKHKQHHINRKSYDGSSRGAGNGNYSRRPPQQVYQQLQNPAPFSIHVTSMDEAICAHRARQTMDMLRRIRVEPIPELRDVYIASDMILARSLQQHLDALEVSKQQATETWLRTLPQQEQERYLQRVGYTLSLHAQPPQKTRTSKDKQEVNSQPS
jgi:hypothetical protein